MLQYPRINLHFEDNNDSFYLIRYGKKEHLENIQRGKIWFSKTSKYRHIENINIGDEHEGLSSIHYTNNDTEYSFSHSNINNGKEIGITRSISSMWDYPNSNTYVSCFSYFTAKDIAEKTIFDDSILNEKEWEYVLFILDTKGFVENIMKSLKKYNPIFNNIKYFDDSVTQIKLDAFSKSNKFKYQKEIRLAFDLVDESNSCIKRIDDETIEVTFEKTASVLIPTNGFREGFSIIKINDDKI